MLTQGHTEEIAIYYVGIIASRDERTVTFASGETVPVVFGGAVRGLAVGPRADRLLGGGPEVDEHDDCQEDIRHAEQAHRDLVEQLRERHLIEGHPGAVAFCSDTACRLVGDLHPLAVVA